jgi:hypothetical protein
MKKSSCVTLTILAGIGCAAYAQQQPPPTPVNPPVNCTHGKPNPQTPVPCPVTTHGGFGSHGAAVQAHAAS